MKKAIITAALAIFMLNGYSQREAVSTKASNLVKIPEVVKKSFATQYPKTAKVNWSIEKPGEYEAEFILNKTAMSVLYDRKGKLLETESGISKLALPKTIQRTLANKYANYKIGEIVVNKEKGVTTYEIEVKKNGKTLELKFDKNGKTLTQQKD